MSFPQENINAHVNNNFKVQFSNIPTVANFGDMRFLYDQKVLSVSIPDFNLELTTSHYLNEVHYSPISKKNDDLSDLLIEFKVDENFLNYYNLFAYMRRVRRGETSAPNPAITPAATVKAEGYIKNYDIESVNLIILNNVELVKATIKFKNAFLTSLSTVSLSKTDPTETTFTATLKYKNIEIQLEDPENPS